MVVSLQIFVTNRATNRRSLKEEKRKERTKVGVGLGGGGDEEEAVVGSLTCKGQGQSDQHWSYFEVNINGETYERPELRL